MNRVLQFFKYDKLDKETVLIEPSIGIKIFTWIIIGPIILSVIFFYCCLFIFKMYDFLSLSLILICNPFFLFLSVFLYAEMCGTHMLLQKNKVVVVWRIIKRVEIPLTDITGYRISACSNVRGEFPMNFKVLTEKDYVNFNINLCTHKKINELKNWFEAHGIYSTTKSKRKLSSKKGN